MRVILVQRAAGLLVGALAVAAAGCVSDVDDSGATGSYSAVATVTSARASAGFVTYGAPLRSWKVRMITADSCDAAAVAELEINLTAAENVPPVGNIPFRIERNPQTLPSALFTSATATLLSGTITIGASSATRLEGSFDAMVMLDGTAQVVSGMFVAPTCE